MDTMKRVALGARLGRAEVELEEASAKLDGSLESRTRLQRAKEEYRAAEAAVLEALGARAAVELVEERLAEALNGSTPAEELPPQLRMAS